MLSRAMVAALVTDLLDADAGKCMVLCGRRLEAGREHGGNAFGPAAGVVDTKL